MDSRSYYIELNKILSELESQVLQISGLNPDVYDTEANYAEILKSLNDRIRAVKRLLAGHSIAKMSKQQFLGTLTNQTAETTYTVKQYDTATSIAQYFNLSLEDLLKRNSITAKDIIPGKELIVPAITQDYGTDVSEIPTFGDQTGKLILGNDAGSSFAESGIGDLEILTPENTFSQGVINRLKTLAKQYPGEDDFGLDVFIGSELEQDTLNSLLMVKVLTQLALDKRVESVENLEVVRESNGVIVKGTINSIGNLTQVTL